MISKGGVCNRRSFHFIFLTYTPHRSSSLLVSIRLRNKDGSITFSEFVWSFQSWVVEVTDTDDDDIDDLYAPLPEKQAAAAAAAAVTTTISTTSSVSRKK